jgi:hypothetical protein
LAGAQSLLIVFAALDVLLLRAIVLDRCSSSCLGLGFRGQIFAGFVFLFVLGLALLVVFIGLIALFLFFLLFLVSILVIQGLVVGDGSGRVGLCLPLLLSRCFICRSAVSSAKTTTARLGRCETRLLRSR